MTGAFLSCILLFALVFTGCGSETRVSKQVKKTKEGLEIGISFDTFSLERWQRDRDIFTSAAAEMGVEVNVQSANGDIEKQKSQLRYFIDKKVDAIVIVQVADEEKDLSTEVTRAKEEGIPVIAYDRLIRKSNVDLYISFDNELVGRMMAAHMIAHMKEGKILMINGPLSDFNCVQIENGFSRALEENGPKMELVGIEHAAGWYSEYGFEYTENYIQEYGGIKGIMAGNDGLAGEVLTALAEYRMAGDVCVVGQDADLAACQRIVEGTQCMTVYKPIEKLAKRAAELAVALAKGEVLDKEMGTINDGIYDVPYCKLMPIAVTKGNMDEYITGQYHSAEDIYLNVDPEHKAGLEVGPEEEEEATDTSWSGLIKTGEM